VSDPHERDQLAAARQELGRQLAAWRARAGMTQRGLARLTGYSRSAIASAEAGQPAAAAFWLAVDRATGAGGRLAAAQARIEAAVAAARRQAARAAWEVRMDAAEPGTVSAPPQDAPMAVTDSPCPRCGQPLTVTIHVNVAPTPQISGADPSISPP
jgi:DNA-binding XRE family transcriptional regulator